MTIQKWFYDICVDCNRRRADGFCDDGMACERDNCPRSRTY